VNEREEQVAVSRTAHEVYALFLNLQALFFFPYSLLQDSKVARGLSKRAFEETNRGFGMSLGAFEVSLRGFGISLGGFGFSKGAIGFPKGAFGNSKGAFGYSKTLIEQSVPPA
jgi:hypothetical protein